MQDRGREGRVQRAFVLAGVLALLSGCAHINEEQFAAEMDRIREEMRASDQGVEGRLAARMDEMDDDIQRRLSMLESDLGALRTQFDVTVERLESAIRFNAPIHFVFDEAEIQPEDEAVLDHFAQVLISYYDRTIITVEGFTDPAGTVEYNLTLGESRAEAVTEHLEARGIPAERMRTVSYGEAAERQIVPDSQGPGETGWENRRVSIVIDFRGPTGTPVALN